MQKISNGTLEKKIVEELKTCFDPEIPVDIYSLGLIYEIRLDEENNAFIKMTLTSPACPVAESLPLDVDEKVGKIEGVKSSNVELVWDPPWNKDMMSEDARLALDMM